MLSLRIFMIPASSLLVERTQFHAMLSSKTGREAKKREISRARAKNLQGTAKPPEMSSGVSLNDYAVHVTEAWSGRFPTSAITIGGTQTHYARVPRVCSVRACKLGFDADHSCSDNGRPR